MGTAPLDPGEGSVGSGLRATVAATEDEEARGPDATLPHRRRFPRLPGIVDNQSAFPSKPLKDTAPATRWVGDFLRWHNHEHRHTGIAFVRSIDQHDGRDIATLEERKLTSAKAKERHPQRWGSRPLRSWRRPERASVRPRRNPDLDFEHDDSPACR